MRWTRSYLEPPEDPHADEIAALLDERDHVWQLLCEAEDAVDTDAIEAYQERLNEIDREVDYIASGDFDEDMKAEVIISRYSD